MITTRSQIGRHFWYQGGVKTVGTIAAIGLVVALLVTTMAIFSTNGGQVGSAATARISEFITNGATFTPNLVAQHPFQPDLFEATPSQPSVYKPTVGVPIVFQVVQSH